MKKKENKQYFLLQMELNLPSKVRSLQEADAFTQEI